MKNLFYMGADGTLQKIDKDSKSVFVDTSFPLNKYGYSQYPDTLARLYSVSILIYRCVSVKANAARELPIRILDDTGTVVNKTHKAYKILGTRNKRLWSKILKDWNIYGKFYLNPVFNKRFEFQRINPITMYADRNEWGIHKFIQRVNGVETRSWEPNELVFIYDYNSEDDLNGSSPTEYALRLADIEMSLRDFTFSFFQNGANPSGLLMTEETLRPTERERYAREWQANYGGAKQANKVAVLGDGLQFKQLTPAIKDLVIDTLSEQTAIDICNAFGVPISIALSSVKGTSGSDKDNDRESLYRETLIPEMNLLLQELECEALPFFCNDELTLEVDLERVSVLQNDLQGITERASTRFKFGLGTLNEARQLDNLPPIEGGNSLFLGGRLIPVDKLADSLQTNMILEGQPLNQSFETNPTEPVNPNPYRQAERLRNEEPKINTQSTKNLNLVIADLRLWKKKVLAKGNNTEFGSAVIPPAIKTLVTIDLMQQETKSDTQDYFNKLIRNLASVAEEDLTDFSNYWDGVSDLLLLYRDKTKELLFRGLLEEISELFISGVPTQDAVDNLIAKRTAAAENELTAIIAQISTLGYTSAYGDDSNSEVKGIISSIQDAISSAVQTTKKQLEEFRKTTVSIVRTKFEQWTRLGGKVKQFGEYLKDKTITTPANFVADKLHWLFTDSRLATWVDTNVREVFNRWFAKAAEDRGKKLKLKTALDEKVCSFCGPLEGVVGYANEGFIHPETNELVGLPPFHPKCRCYTSLVAY